MFGGWLFLAVHGGVPAAVGVLFSSRCASRHSLQDVCADVGRGRSRQACASGTFTIFIGGAFSYVRPPDRRRRGPTPAFIKAPDVSCAHGIAGGNVGWIVDDGYCGYYLGGPFTAVGRHLARSCARASSVTAPWSRRFILDPDGARGDPRNGDLDRPRVYLLDDRGAVAGGVSLRSVPRAAARTSWSSGAVDRELRSQRVPRRSNRDHDRTPVYLCWSDGSWHHDRPGAPGQLRQ